MPALNARYWGAPAIVTGESVGAASVVYDSTTSQWVTNVHFINDDFLRKIARPLGRSAARRSSRRDRARRCGGVCARDNPGITGRDVEISGSFTEREAKDLAVVVRYGALPVHLQFVSATTTS